MRTLTRRIFALVLPVFAGAALLGCEEVSQQPQGLDETEVAADHTSSDASRTVTLEAVKTEAARRHGFQFGDDVGTVTITDESSADPHDIVVSGTASGLDPDNSLGYVSLFYDLGSPETGPRACEPTVFDPNDEDFLTNAQMAGGVWEVDGDGNGTLLDIDGEYVSLDKIGSISIRDTRIGGGFGTQAVVACADVN